ALPRKELADRLGRLGAKLIDGFVTALACLPGAVFIMALHDESNARTFGVGLLLVGYVAIITCQCVFLSMDGQTIGKKAMRIRIVRNNDEGNPGFVGAVVLRSWVPNLISAVPGIGPLFTVADVAFIFGEDRRCLHDYIAGTSGIEA